MKRYVEKFNSNDEETVAQAIDNVHAYEWMENNVPYFECSDKAIEETYYFRWWVYRKHIKKTPEGYIITEFHPDVNWAGAYNSINAASGHHIADGRWMKQGEKYMEDYIRFWFKGTGSQYAYSSWIVQSVYEYCCVKNDYALAMDLLEDFQEFYAHVEKTNLTEQGLFWSLDYKDAMEMSVSGSGLRPTLNSYMYANAMAISKIAKKAENKEIEKLYKAKANSLKEKMNELLWDAKEQFFKVVPQNQIADKIITFSPEEYGDRNVKELIGYIPWAFGLGDKEQDGAWEYLKNDDCFYTAYGLTTADQNHAKYLRENLTHECLWNGPIWPFATTQVLNSMIAYLQGDNNSAIQKKDFFVILKDYAKSHYRITKDGRKINWVDESIDPRDGSWLSRHILEQWEWREDKGGYERGKDYNHSSFADIVIRGICGVSLGERDEICINSAIQEADLDYFKIDDLPYKNHSVTVLYDKSGERYQRGKGLFVDVDNKCRAHSEKLEKIMLIL